MLIAMPSFSATTAIALFTLIAAVRADLAINWPATIITGTNAEISWSGDAPFTFAVFNNTDTSQPQQQIFQVIDTNETTVAWPATVSSGTTVIFYVSDSSAAFVESDPVVVSSSSVSQSTTSSSSTSSIASSTTTSSTTTHTTSSSTTSHASSTSSSQSSSTTSSPSSSPTSPPASSTTPSPDTSSSSTTSPSPSSTAAASPSMSSDHTIPYIIGSICGVVGLVILLVAIRFFLKRRKRLQAARNAANGQMRYWPNDKGVLASASGAAGGKGSGWDAEKGMAMQEKKPAANDSSDRASASSEDLLLNTSAPNSASTAALPLPLHLAPYGMETPAHASPNMTSPMLPPASLPNPFADQPLASTSTAPAAYPYATRGLAPKKSGTLSSKKSTGTLLTNARASSVFLPLGDEGEEYEDIDISATPTVSSHQHGFGGYGMGAGGSKAPTSWKVGQIVSQHGEWMPSPTLSSGPKSAVARQSSVPAPFPSSSQHPYQPHPYSSVNSSNYPSMASRASSIPPSPSPFDDVVFDLGALPPSTVTPSGLGRMSSTRTTTGVRKAVRERKASAASTSTASASVGRAQGRALGMAAQRSPPANFPSDAHDDFEDEIDVGEEGEWTPTHTPMSADARRSMASTVPSMYSTFTTSTSASSHFPAPTQPIPPVPPLNLSKLGVPTPFTSSTSNANRKSAIPSPPHSASESSVHSPVEEDVVPMTAQSDGEYVRRMMADVFGNGDASTSTPAPAPRAVTPPPPPAPTNHVSPTRRPPPGSNWI